MSDSASTIELLVLLHAQHVPDALALSGFCWQWHHSATFGCTCLPAACREAFPAAVVIVHASLREPILKLMEASTGGTAAVYVAECGRQGLNAK